MEIEKFLTERDREVFTQAGYGREMELGRRPALLVIDVTYEFTGEKREPILEAIKKIRTACGEEAWDAVDNMEKLIKAARRCSIPVIYTANDRGPNGGPFAKKNRRSGESYAPHIYEFVAEIAPEPGDLVIRKIAPSIFRGTNLNYYLISQGIDTLVVTGGVTSGCVRASAVDAFSFGYRVVIAREGVYDRSQTSHAVNLFDLQAKYANLSSTGEIIKYMESLA